jgi:hypothetical protein
MRLARGSSSWGQQSAKTGPFDDSNLGGFFQNGPERYFRIQEEKQLLEKRLGEVSAACYGVNLAVRGGGGGASFKMARRGTLV